MVRFSIYYFPLFTVMAIAYPYLQFFLRERRLSDAQVGCLQEILALAGICGPLLLGHLADRTGRRRVLLIACLAAYALLLPLNVTHTFWVAAPLAAGIGFAVRTTIPLTDTVGAGKLADPIHRYGRVPIERWGHSVLYLTYAVPPLVGVLVLTVRERRLNVKAQ